MGQTYYLGTHKPQWLGQVEIPLFISYRQLRRRCTFRSHAKLWAIDSGGFSELSLFGKWTISAQEYAEDCAWITRYVGGLQFAAIQDWMCEPFILAKTGLSVAEHQRRTVANYAALLQLAPTVPWAPVLQGYTPQEYLTHLRMYETAGHTLRNLPTVGLGSVCRRHSSAEILQLVTMLYDLGLHNLHGFGVKTEGLRNLWPLLQSADSMAWSFAARCSPPLPGCPHQTCSNCAKYALQWYQKTLRIFT